MKHRIALLTKATILKIIKTVDSTTTVVLFLDSSCSCKMANTSPLVSPGSMLFMAQTQEAKTFLCVDNQQLIFCKKKKIRERMHLIYRWRKLSGISVLFYLKGINCSQLSLTYVLKQQIIFFVDESCSYNCFLPQTERRMQRLILYWGSHSGI